MNVVELGSRVRVSNYCRDFTRFGSRFDLFEGVIIRVRGLFFAEVQKDDGEIRVIDTLSCHKVELVESMVNK